MVDPYETLVELNILRPTPWPLLFAREGILAEGLIPLQVNRPGIRSNRLLHFSFPALHLLKEVFMPIPVQKLLVKGPERPVTTLVHPRWKALPEQVQCFSGPVNALRAEVQCPLLPLAQAPLRWFCVSMPRQLATLHPNDVHSTQWLPILGCKPWQVI